MSYLPSNPYASMAPVFPPQAGLGGQAPITFPGANPMGAPTSLPGGADPMAALQGLQGQMGGFPGAPAGGAGMGQDSFGPAQGAMPGIPQQPGQPPQGQQQAGVFQHQSGGFADKNASLSGGSYWTSWKPWAALAGTAAVIAGGVMAYKHFNKEAAVEAGTKLLNQLDGDLRTKLDSFIPNTETAKETFLKGLTKENVAAQKETFIQSFDDVVSDTLKKEVTTEEYGVVEAYKTAHSASADAIETALKGDKPTTGEPFKELNTKIDDTKAALQQKLQPAKAGQPATPEIGKAAVAAGTKLLNQLDGDLKTKLDSFVPNTETAKETFLKDLTKENVATQKETFIKSFDDLVSDTLKKEVTAEEYGVVEAYKTAHSASADAIETALKGDKPTTGEAFKELNTKIDDTKAALQQKLQPAKSEKAAAGQDGATAAMPERPWYKFWG